MPQARVQVKHPYLTLAGLYFGSFAGMYSETALNVALPQLSAAFNIELALAQWLVVGYMLAIGIVLPFAGLLMKWISTKKLTIIALASFFIGSIVSAVAQDFTVCLIGRLLQGAGVGIILPVMFAMVLEVFPPHKIGAAMGINALIVMSASAVGPTLAGLLIGALSWRVVFVSFAVLLFIGFVFQVKYGVDPYELTKPRIDLLSVITSCLGFGGVVLGVGVASLYGWGSPITIVSLIVGVVSLVVYVKRQLKLEAPVIDMRVFTISGFRTAALCVMLNFGITLSVMYVLPQFYQNSMLIAVSMTGLIMLPGGVVNALMSMLAGRIYDRIGARVPALVGFCCSGVAAALLFFFATPESPLPFVMACHVLLMIGVPLAMSPCQTHALAALPPRLSGDGSTMVNTMQQVFGAIATAIATFLVATGQSAYMAAGSADTAWAFTQGVHWALAFGVVLAVVAFVVALRFKSNDHGAEKNVGKVEEKGGKMVVTEGNAPVFNN